MPGGALEEGEDFKSAARRECREEAGIDVELKGILQIDHAEISNEKQPSALMRVIFYAEPTSIEMAH